MSLNYQFGMKAHCARSHFFCKKVKFACPKALYILNIVKFASYVKAILQPKNKRPVTNCCNTGLKGKGTNYIVPLLVTAVQCFAN